MRTYTEQYPDHLVNRRPCDLSRGDMVISDPLLALGEITSGPYPVVTRIYLNRARHRTILIENAFIVDDGLTQAFYLGRFLIKDESMTENGIQDLLSASGA